MHVTLEEVLKEGDPLLSTDFLVEMDIPFEIKASLDSAQSAFSSTLLRVLCLSVNIPEKSASTISVNLFGHVFKHRGKREEAPPLEIQFQETRSMPVYRTLNSWFEYTNKSNSGDSPNKIGNNRAEGYSTNIYITPLTITGERAAEFVFYNAWIKNTPSYQFTGESATPVQAAATFEFDYFALNPGVSVPGLGNIGSFAGAADILRRFGLSR